MQEGLIGVIVPVYKVEKYIAECIDSILAQTYTKFRLILVDDGTPDNAGKICDEYAEKDPRITVIHQENSGVTRARARGVEEAEDCEFITFVDGDDTITVNALQTMCSYTNNDIDIVVSAFDNSYIYSQNRITSIEYRHMAVKNEKFIGAACGKLIKRVLFNNFIFDIPSWIKVHEDTLMNIRIAFNTNQYIAFCQKTYNYRLNESGAMKTVKKDVKYEEHLHKHLIASIPADELNTYIRDTIPYRLLQWRNLYMYRYNVNGMTKENFYIDLKNDIKKSGFKLYFIERILFNNTNPFIRFIAINIKKISNKFRSFL